MPGLECLYGDLMDPMWNEYNKLFLSYLREELSNVESFEFKLCGTHANGLSSNIWFVMNLTLVSIIPPLHILFSKHSSTKICIRLLIQANHKHIHYLQE